MEPNVSVLHMKPFGLFANPPSTGLRSINLTNWSWERCHSHPVGIPVTKLENNAAECTKDILTAV